MRKNNIIGMALIALWIISIVPIPPIMNTIIRSLYQDKELVTLDVTQSLVVALGGVLRFVVNIGMAIWLFGQSKMDRNPPFLWAALGLFFGAMGAVLYFIKQIYDKISVLELDRK